MRLGKEKLKNYILMFLIGFSIVQMYIYYNYQSGNRITTFIENFYKKDKYNFNINEYFIPCKIVLSEGFDGDHYLLKNDTKEYNDLWNDAKKYLKDLLETEDYVDVMDYTDEAWSNIIKRKSVLIEFYGEIDSDLISTFLGNEFELNIKPENIEKILMQPFDSVNNVMTFYVANDVHIYKVVSPITRGRLDRKYYNELLKDMANRKSQVRYSLMQEIFPNKETSPFSISPDVLVSINNETERYNAYFSMLPILLDDIKITNSKDIEDLSFEILGNNKDYYDIGVDINNTIVFKNLENIFRIHKDGLLEYKYLGSTNEKTATNVAKAFNNVTDFIANLKGLVEGADITLVKTEKLNSKNDNGYKFTFDYRLDDMPVLIDHYVSEETPSIKLDHAIEIISKNNKVVSCTWILRDFGKADEGMDYYIGFEEILDNAFKKNNIKRDSLKIDCLYTAYIVSLEEDEILTPQVILNYKRGTSTYYSVPLTRKDEDIELGDR